MTHFKKGVVLGGLLGAVAMWLAASPKGKEFREEHIDPLYNQLAASLQQLEGPTKDMYFALVDRAVEEYGAKKQLAEDVKNQIVKNLKKRWKELQKSL